MKIGCIVNLQDSVEASFAEAVKLNLHSGQLAVWNMELYTDEMVEKVKAFCQEHSFEITAVWCGWSGRVVWKYPEMYTTLGLVPSYMRWQRTEDIIKGAHFAAKLGVKNIVSHIGYFPDNPYDKDHIEIVHCMRVIGTELNKSGQRFLFETGEELPVTLRLLIDEIGTGNMGVNFDPANLTSSGRANSLDALRMFKGYIFGVHAKDATYPIPGEPKGKETVLGEGEAHVREMIHTLKSFGYDGPITIEREINDPEQRLIDIAEACRKLKMWEQE